MQWIPLSRVRQVECQTAIIRIAVGHVLKKLRERPDRKRALPRVSLMAGDLRRRVPRRQVAADGGYASQHNLTAAKARGVNDVAFHKKRGLTVEVMVKSRWVYRKLRNFRAGIEAGISCLKRAYGLARCTWRGLDHFKTYIWSAVVAHNLVLLARLKPP